MKKITILLIVFVVLFSLIGVNFTGLAVLDKTETQLQKDEINLQKALNKGKERYCSSIQDQLIREECFTKLADNLHDISICNNLLPNSRKDCELRVLE